MEIFKIKNRTYDLEKKPLVMGILNVTPDSFSDGSAYFSTDKALRQVEKMVGEGADIIDIGGESSRPGAELIGEAEELDRIAAVVSSVHEHFEIPVSVDTYKGGVAREVLKLGAAMINDIFALTKSPEIAQYVAAAEAGLCLMHLKGTPRNMQDDTGYDNILDHVAAFLKDSLGLALERGVKKESICLDPGIGFGKSVAGNLTLLNHLAAIGNMGCPLLIGTSRKSFIGKVLDVDVAERLAGTIASNVVSLMRGGRIFRVHDVRENRQALDLAFAIMKARG